jgi:hypothetical protein
VHGTEPAVLWVGHLIELVWQLDLSCCRVGADVTEASTAGGVKTREVSCVDVNNTAVAANYCTGKLCTT